MELAPLVRTRFFDSNGDPLAGGKLYTYEAGTSTPKATYSNRAGATNTNPIILDANGECDVWLDSGFYKFTLTDSADVLQWTKDNIANASDATNASALFRDVVYITFANSPLTLDSTYNGKWISVDSSGGAVTINLPEISSVIMPYNIGVKLRTGSNAITINRSGTDTIEGSSSKSLATTGYGVIMAADTDQTPDQWALFDVGGVADGGVTRDKLAIGAVAVPNRRTVAGNATVLTTDDEIYITAEGTVTLLAANTVGARPVRIINAIAAGGTVTVTRSGSDTIWGETSQFMYQLYDNLVFIPDGSSKYNIGG